MISPSQAVSSSISSELALSPRESPTLNGDVVLEVLERYLECESASKNLHLLTLYKGLSDRLVYRYFERVFVRNKSDLAKINFALLFRPYARAKVKHLTIAYKHPKGHRRSIYCDRSGRYRPLKVTDLLPVLSLLARCSELESLVFVGSVIPPHRCHSFRQLAFRNITRLEGPLWMTSTSIDGLYRGRLTGCLESPLPPSSWPTLKTLVTSAQGRLPTSFIKRAFDLRHLPSLEHLHITLYDFDDKKARRCLSSLRCPPSTKYALLSSVVGNELVIPFETVDLPSIWAHPKAQILAPRIEVEWLKGVSESWTHLEGYMAISLLQTGDASPSQLEARAAERVGCVLAAKKDLQVMYGFDLSGWVPDDDRCAFFHF
ncbi:hypothetical protein V5O48_007104 [Marasmius crinis-equi]|uniref:Uncharacterized protein n=1 Tax=Marasmius crinis-equi TaxID=585013 RepID=A0ABR3FHM6_9AGAR